MAENQNSGSPAKTLAPGQIDKTRKNIGPVDPTEAVEMTKILGGDILKERSAPVDTSKMPKRPRQQEIIRASGKFSSDISASSGALKSTFSETKVTQNVNQMMNTGNSQKKRKTDAELPAMSPRDLKLIDKCMMSFEYQLKPNYGLFNIFYRMSAKNREKVVKSFGGWTVKKHVEHLQSFITTIKLFIQQSPDSYKSKIAQEPDLKFKFLRTVGKWTMRDLKVIALDLQNTKVDLTVAMLVPFVRTIYKDLITVNYIGEQQVPAMIKEVYNDITAYPSTDHKQMQNLAKQGITEWLYIHNQIIKGMYPLLMRMCSPCYEEYSKFFTNQIGPILSFLGRTKFELLLPEKKKPVKTAKQKAEEAQKKLEENRHVAGKKDELVNTGLKILEQLFPQAGFSSLDSHPDMYPYFQPMYKFADGFNMLNPENGVQVTVVLIKILEDFFQGCRNIKFNFEGDEKLSALKDSITDTMNDWASYREVLFEKKYCDYLKNFVNALYSKADYASTQFGKESLTNIMWRQKYYFLPNYRFQQLVLNKPNNDSPYKPLADRTDYVKTAFTLLARRIDENYAGKKTVLGVNNPWDRYSFDLPNTVSKRLDVLLGAKKDDATTAATNANLIKYTLCVMAVLDWWVNNTASPAYTGDPNKIWRVSEDDGGPAFSAPERSDQNQLFAEGIKKAFAAKK